MDTELLVALCKSVQHFRSFLLEENNNDTDDIEDTKPLPVSSPASTSSTSPFISPVVPSSVPSSIPLTIRNHPELQSLFHPRKPYTIPRIHVDKLTPVQFLQRYVIPQKPVILIGAISDWTARKHWIGKAGLQYLRNISNPSLSSPIDPEPLRTNQTCTFTPNGRADAIYHHHHHPSSSSSSVEEKHIFVQPVEHRLPFPTILDILEKRALIASKSTCLCENNFDPPPIATQVSTPNVSTTTTTTTAAVAAVTVSEVNSSSADDGNELPCGYAYLSVQNDNLRQELPCLLSDLGNKGTASVAIGTEALGVSPDAINIWIGYPGNTSSLHKDHYDNLLTVITGIKRFILYPPTDILWLYERLYPTGKFVHHKELCTVGNSSSTTCTINPSSLTLPPCWSITMDKEVTQNNEEQNIRIPWISIDPEHPNYDKYPLSYFASPLTVDIHTDETLYLPSLWYHHVSHPYIRSCSQCGNEGYRRNPQYSVVPRTVEEALRYQYQDSNGNTGITIAINSWFDMNYMSQHWAIFNSMKELASLIITRNGKDENNHPESSE